MLALALKHYLELRSSQWRPREELMDLQQRRLGALIAHAYENVPFYRAWFDRAGVKPADIRGPSDLSLLPPCAKDDLRPAFSRPADNFKAADCVEAVTSGSTGAPLKFYMDKRSLAFRFAMNLRTLEFSTYRLGKKLFQVSPPLSGKLKSGLKTKLIDAALRRLTVPPFEQDLETKLNQLLAYRPDAIVGYTSYIKSLADLVQTSGASCPLGSVMTTSEKLLPGTRRQLHEVFGGQVFDQYGSVESGRAATECAAGRGYHINVEGVLIEIVNEAGEPAAPGESGEVLVTNLLNYASPFVRYRVGDRAALAPDRPCECGRELPRLDRIEGRLNDIILAPDGRRILPEYFYLTLREIDGLAQFQIRQESTRGLKVLYTREADFNEEQRRQVELEYERYLSDMSVIWEPVKRIEKIAGKHRHIVALKKNG